MTSDPLRSAREFCAGIVAERWPGASIESIEAMRGDASTRSYARLAIRGGPALPGGKEPAPATLVVMMMQDAAVAMSSEELGVYGKDGPKELAFVNVGRFLARHTDTVPAIFAVSDDSRLLLLEDVGDTSLWEASQASPSETFGRALDLVADLQARVIDDGSGCYAFRQSFDERLFAWEFEHFLEYGVAGAPDSLMEASRRELLAVAKRLAALPRVFAHRDYHAWNIHVQNGRLRLIDFQDALLAPALYDVASLLTDRITPERITPGIEESLLVRFYARQKAGRLESLAATRSAYRLLALQRVLKVVGRFHYLAEVKGKPHYLAMLPAVCRTATRLLAGSEGVKSTAELFELAARDPSRPGGAPPIARAVVLRPVAPVAGPVTVPKPAPPIIEQPIIEQPIIEQPTVEQPTVDQPAEERAVATSSKPTGATKATRATKPTVTKASGGTRKAKAAAAAPEQEETPQAPLALVEATNAPAPDAPADAPPTPTRRRIRKV